MNVESYRIDLTIDEKDYRFSGKEDIGITVDGDDLELDSVGINTGKVEVDGKPAEFSTDRDLLVIRGMEKGRHIVSVWFDGAIGQNLTGLYLAKTEESDMFTTQFESTGARRVFPCIDNPAYKAKFTVTLNVAEDMDAISNMPPESTSIEGGRKTVVFPETPEMSTYLLYLGAGKFEEKRRKYNGIDLILAAPVGHLSPSDFPLEVAEKCLKIYEEYFGIKYMLPKMHLISVPEFAAGAMENWGALTFREILLYSDRNTGSQTRKRIAAVIAHEIAHQWFGDLVTMKWWNDLWLNESFATFMSYRIINEIYPEMDAFGEMIMTRTQGAFSDDSLVNSHPIDVDVKDPNSVAQIFDQISYGKGASVLRMIESFVGKENFRKGISSYLKAHSYSNTRGADLWASIEKASELPVSRIMEAWIKKQGYPVVEAASTDSGIHVGQSRFLINGSSTDDHWPVPLTVMRSGGPESILMDEAGKDITAEGFIKLNVDQTGFYRTLYRGDLLETVKNGLGKMNFLDRWGIVNDYYAFLLSGRVGLDQYMSLLRAFAQEEHHTVIEEITSQLMRLHMKAPENQRIKGVAVEVTSAFLESLGKKRDGEDMNTSILRGSLSQKLAVLDPGHAGSLSRQFTGLDEADPDLAGAVILSYAIHSNDFGGLIDRFRKAGSDEERTKIISALGWLRNRNDLEEANRMVLQGEIKRQDSMTFFSSIAACPWSREFAFEHLEESTRFLLKTFAGSRRASAALESTVPLIGMGRVDEMMNVLARLKSPETEKGILKGTELLEVNTNFRKKYGSS